jgi:nitric oxide dioxygenase
MDKNFRELISYSESGILSKVIVKNDKTNITLFSMAANTEISEHTSTKQGFVYVIEGDGTFNLQGKEIPMNAGTFVYMDANAVHSIKVKADTSFVLVLANN